MSAARPSAADSWGCKEWERYRADQLAAIERCGPSDALTRNVALADHHLALMGEKA